MREYREIYRAEQFPIFQNRMFSSAEEARNCPKGDIVLVQDMGTGMIFNQAFKPEIMQYDSDYQNEQAFSTFFRQHLQSVSQIIQKHFRNSSLIEIGCGKAHFLEKLQELGFAITGFDPTYEGSNPAIIKDYFNPEIGIQADGLILRHVLEHIQDPVRFLSKILHANNGSGKVYIEVPCFDWIASNQAWFDIFYEHVNYFRLSDFHRMFGTIYESGHIFGGQYLYVVADLQTLKIPVYEKSIWFDLPNTFLSTVDRYVTKIRAQKNKACIWGGASKGVIFSLFMSRAGAKIDMCIDINPAKQGKYIASTGIRISSPEEVRQTLIPGSDILLMNKNYLSEIIDLTNNQFNYLAVDNESF
jgi:Methyltransferase domain/C-methyltransferase C-terminal domain